MHIKVAFSWIYLQLPFWNNFYNHSLQLIQEGQLSVTGERKCTNLSSTGKLPGTRATNPTPSEQKSILYYEEEGPEN